MFNVAPFQYIGNNPYGFSIEWWIKNIPLICDLGKTTTYYSNYCALHVQISANPNFFKENYWKSCRILLHVEVKLSDHYTFKQDFGQDELIQSLLYIMHKYYHIDKTEKSENVAPMTTIYAFTLQMFNYEFRYAS